MSLNSSFVAILITFSLIVGLNVSADARRVKESASRDPNAVLINEIAVARAKALLADVSAGQRADQLLYLIATAELEAGNGDDAARTASRIGNPETRYKALAEVVEQRLFEGSVADAVTAVKAIDDELTRASTLRDIAEELADRQEFDAARDLADTIALKQDVHIGQRWIVGSINQRHPFDEDSRRCAHALPMAMKCSADSLGCRTLTAGHGKSQVRVPA